MPQISDVLTIGAVAERLGTQVWMIDRMFRRKLLPEPPRFLGRRVFTEADIPAIKRALESTGYLKPKKARK